MLRIYNTLAGKKEVFEPSVPGRVGMYVCGVTVYDVCHIGHARSALVFEVIRRYLGHKGLKVTYVRNFTDIDDKIIARAQNEGADWREIAQRYIGEYYRDMASLGVAKADVEPKATDHLGEMQKIIDGLMEKGYAYRTDGDVYYRVKSFGGYGKLSKRNTEEMLAGARVEIDEKKEDPLDFALWKASKPGEPWWKSPWGDGRPGWHIECSAMSMKYLGPTFDIHGGGKDLIFPHHENEIAQSEAYTGAPFARYWIHNGFVNVNQEKMSKSLGNFFTIREIFEKYPYSEKVTAEVLRYFLISSHYRSPLDFSDQGMRSAHAALDGFYDLLLKLIEVRQAMKKERSGDQIIREAMSLCRSEFEEAMDDDFNTAGGLGSLQKLKKTVNSVMDRGTSTEVAEELEILFNEFGNLLCIFSIDPREWEFFKPRTVTAEVTVLYEYLSKVSKEAKIPYEVISDDEVNRLVAEREEARRKKDWKRSDEIRKMLAERGVILEDRPDGTTRVKR